MLTWLLQDNQRDRTSFHALSRALDDLGEVWLPVSLVPFSPDLPAIPPEVAAGRIICMGAGFVPRVVGCGWSPGIFFDPSRFRWSAMREAWHELMLSDDAQVVSLGEARDALERSGRSAFVRPDADDKRFDGGVYDVDALRDATPGCDASMSVVMAAPRPIDAEWRCFVVDGEIVDGSEYRRAGQPSMHAGVPARVAALAEQAAARWVPAPVVCIDVASSGDRLGVVEANCFNASRFYAADPGVVLARVAAHVTRT